LDQDSVVVFTILMFFNLFLMNIGMKEKLNYQI